VARQRAQEIKVKHAWEVSGVHVWFHYTTLEHASEIAARRCYVVSGKGHQRVGAGLFLTNVAPGSKNDDDILKDLFAYQRPPDVLQGVIVLARNEELLPIEQFAQHKWVHRVPAGSVVDLTPLFLGYGQRNEFNGEWIFSDSLHVPD